MPHFVLPFCCFSLSPSHSLFLNLFFALVASMYWMLLTTMLLLGVCRKQCPNNVIKSVLQWLHLISMMKRCCNKFRLNSYLMQTPIQWTNRYITLFKLLEHVVRRNHIYSLENFFSPYFVSTIFAVFTSKFQRLKCLNCFLL